MKYKLLKDLPGAKAGKIINYSENGYYNLVIGYVQIDAELLLNEEWFEPIQEEHKITKKMKEWQKDREGKFDSGKTFWKEFFEELNKQLNE